MGLRTGVVESPVGTIATVSAGAGTPIVVISGGPGLSSDYLVDALSPLASENRLTFFDQPGCGRSEVIQPPTADETVAASAAVVREAVGSDDYWIVAHSWGAFVAARVCAEAPRAPQGTILLNPVPLDRTRYNVIGERLVGRVAPEALARIAELDAEGTLEAGRELMRLALPAYSGRSDSLPTVTLDYSISTFNSVAGSLGDFDLWEVTERMGPLTAVFGSTDYIEPSDYQPVLRNVDLHVLQTGHFSMLDAPQAVTDLIRRTIA